jgi:hypothetical protein
MAELRTHLQFVHKIQETNDLIEHSNNSRYGIFTHTMALRIKSISALVPVTRKPSIIFHVEEDYRESCDASSLLEKGDSNHTLVTADETESSEDQYGPSNRCVRFAVTVKEKKVKSHKSYSEKERNSCWYSREEKDKMSSKLDKVVARMDAGKPERRSRPYRGLHGWTEKGSKVPEFHIDRTINAVMDEQDAQWAADADNDFRLATISQNVTADSIERARHLACQDEQEAIKIHDTMFDDVSDLMDDDSTVNSMASLVAMKRRERARKRRTTKSSDTQKKRIVRRRRRTDESPQQAQKENVQEVRNMKRKGKGQDTEKAKRKEKGQKARKEKRKEKGQKHARKEKHQEVPNENYSRDPPGEKA